MKPSLKKLRGFAARRHERKDHRRFHQPSPQLDELALAAQDMQDMRDCYDRLLSAAAATANSAYEFSESLREMGDCLLEKTALSDDEESGKVLLMLGKVQFQLQKLVDSYRSHIVRTITVPSQSLLNELRIVEEMKRQCDDKRAVYEHMMQKYKDKGKIKGAKGECVSSHQLQVAYDEFDEGANVFVFRMKSLKQGKSRSLLTQATRHHAAQLAFFKKSFKSLEEIEPHVKLVTELRHIDYHFRGLEEDDGHKAGENDEDDSDDDSEESSESLDDGELSFDYRQNEQVNPLTNLMQENFDWDRGGNSFSFRRDIDITKSAPLLSGKKHDLAEGGRQLTPSPSNKFQPCVLPTPVEVKTPALAKSDNLTPQTRRTNLSTGVINLWHSSPLDQNKYEKLVANEKSSGPTLLATRSEPTLLATRSEPTLLAARSEPTLLATRSVLKESNTDTKPSWLPPPLSEGLPSAKHDESNARKVKRHAFSGPLPGNTWPQKPIVSASGPITSTGQSQPLSVPFLHTSLPEASSKSKFSSRASPPFFSSPKISELHELPRPPTYLASTRPPHRIGHSGPLVSKAQDLTATNKTAVSSAASALPQPPTLHRSYSIPSRGQIGTTPHVSKPSEDVVSPPLTPITLPNIRPASPAS